MVTLSFPSQSF